MSRGRSWTRLGVVVLLCAPAHMVWAQEDEDRFRTRLTKDGTGIVGVLPPLNMERMHPGALKALPAVKAGDPFEMDLRSTDVSQLDLTSKLSELRRADFDARTRWPKLLPAGFHPAETMEIGKNPGLGVRSLHAKGITGKGVGIGVVDQGLLVGHQEYKDRLKLYEEIHCLDGVSAMHGPAVASIAVGKTVGVAPDADLYYIAETHVRDEWLKAAGPGANMWDYMDFTVTAKAIDRLLEINRKLPKDRKIRVISISVGWAPSNTGYKEVTAAVERAKRDGVFVISTALERTHGFAFHGLGRDPTGDPDSVSSYTKPSWGDKLGGARLYVPMDARTTASPTGDDEYVFYRQGGWSWVVPYLAGLYAMAVQVKPNVTPDELWQKALQTADTVTLPAVTGAAETMVSQGNDASGKPGSKIVNPVRLIESLQK